MKKDSLYNSGFFPPPWNPNDFPEKTQGWIEFQKYLRKDPGYYLDIFQWPYVEIKEFLDSRLKGYDK